MTRLSRKCQYALQATVELARRCSDRPISAVSIAEALGISDRFLETVLADLRRAGIVKAYRGRRGGYALALAPDEISVGRIIRVFDGPMRTVDCLACGGNRACPSEVNCAFAGLWLRADALVARLMNAATVQDLLAGTFVAETAAAADNGAPATADSLLR